MYICPLTISLIILSIHCINMFTTFLLSHALPTHSFGVSTAFSYTSKHTSPKPRSFSSSHRPTVPASTTPHSTLTTTYFFPHLYKHTRSHHLTNTHPSTIVCFSLLLMFHSLLYHGQRFSHLRCRQEAARIRLGPYRVASIYRIFSQTPNSGFTR